jgi:uncharacterized protein YceK
MFASRRTPLVLVLATTLLGGGCGTISNVKCPTYPPTGNPNARICRAFGGVRDDWAIMSEYPLSKAPTYADYVLIPLMAGIELCFTVAGDTVTLPYTVVEEIRRAYGFGQSSSQSAPTRVSGGTSTAPASAPSGTKGAATKAPGKTPPPPADSTATSPP